MANLPQSREISTATKKQTISTLIGLGSVASLAVFSFLWLGGDIFKLNQEAQSKTIPVIQAASPAATVEKLTRGLFAPGKSTDQLLSIATQRQQVLIKLAELSAEQARDFILAGPVLEQLPSAVSSKLEQEVQLTGQLEIMHYDLDFEQNLSRQELFLLSGGQRIRVFAPSPEAYEEIAAREVKVHGFQVDPANIILATDGTAPAIETTTTVATTALTTRKVAVILFNFQNDTRQSLTVDKARSTVFGSASSINAYDQEVSFGQLGLVGKVDVTGDVYGYYTIPYNNAYNLPLDSTTDCSANYRTWTASARTAAANAGVDLTGYNHYIYLFQAPYCPGAGWAELNADESWAINSSVSVLTHEHGHNLGAMHASAYYCKDAAGLPTTISASCTIGEYSDPFDVMGNPFRHFNNAHKNEVKWLPPTNIQDVTTNGTYTIYPIESTSTGPQALRVARNRNTSGQVSENYWLEYRRPFGIDSFGAADPVVNGVSFRLARVAGVSGYLSPNTLLLDTTPSTSTFTDAPLVAGQVFEDLTYGIRFETVAATPESITVNVTFGTPVCGQAAPTVTLTNPSSIFGSSGQTLPYTLNVTNNDSAACPTATFTVAPTLPAGWTQTPNAPSFTLAPGAVNHTTLNITSDIAATAGEYSFSELVTNTTTSMTGSVSGTYNVTGPDVTAPTVSITNPANGAKLRGKTVKIAASATDASGIASMQILIDGVSKQVCAAATCNYSAQLSTLSSGSHIITATAVDKSANANSGTKSITVTK